MNHRRRTEFYRESSLNNSQVENMEINHAKDRLEENGMITSNSMQVVEVIILGFNLLKEHNLEDWIFVVDNAKGRGGLCRYKTKTISLAEGFILHANAEEIKDTILHEIAHALVGHENGHNYVWRNKAIEIGCTGERCHSVKFSTPNYILKCSKDCGFKANRQRVKVSSLQRNGSYCGRCGGGLILIDLKNNTSTQITKGINGG